MRRNWCQMRAKLHFGLHLVWYLNHIHSKKAATIHFTSKIRGPNIFWNKLTVAWMESPFYSMIDHFLIRILLKTLDLIIAINLDLLSTSCQTRPIVVHCGCGPPLVLSMQLECNRSFEHVYGIMDPQYRQSNINFSMIYIACFIVTIKGTSRLKTETGLMKFPIKVNCKRRSV